MKDLVSHIEFLILEHEYVIIPDLGGFILNKESAYVGFNGQIMPPSFSLGFNAELRFNDGLLVESYMQQYSISYDSALNKINYAVNELKVVLNSKGSFDFGSLGTLNLSDENRILFTPISKVFNNHPRVWGYSPIALKRLSELSSGHAEISANKKAIRKLNLTKISAIAGAAAVAILLFSTISFSDGVLNKVQQSGFISNLSIKHGETIPNYHSNKDFNSENLFENRNQFIITNSQKDEIVVNGNTTTEAKIETIEPVKIERNKQYYIIVGSDTQKPQANRLLAKFKNKGFSNANIVNSSNRYRIYVASFFNKDEANRYLNEFRTKNPYLKDAWLYTK
ncbi:SPOR domain-containing protein [Dysgonomonas sp. 216]|uniref:HU domain-containing protein n=1 Tax=Dysgonomonas sp. 216 TaxID=2302934 RepID=UPI0013D3769D|nr:SPOR domain-containing protein [Dysgonomonas sp. 216]NDW17375.1 SPOR domain-containing protein [Dysgonomonas sp. 216]